MVKYTLIFFKSLSLSLIYIASEQKAKENRK